MRTNFILFLLIGSTMVGLGACSAPVPTPIVIVVTATPGRIPPTNAAEAPSANTVNPTSTPLIAAAPLPANPAAGSSPATPTPPPTLQDDNLCTYKATFQGDVTVPDNTPLLGGSSFVKTWRIRNEGTCPWGNGYALHSLVLTGGNMAGPTGTIEIPNAVVNQGDTIDLSVPLSAPTTPGVYRSEWKLRVDNGTLLGVGANGAVPLYVQIIVPANAVTLAPTNSRITFPPGATQTLVTGHVDAGATQDYHIQALKRQTMMVTLASPVMGNPTLRVLGPSEVGPQVIRTAQDGWYWLGSLPTTGDYIIRVTSTNASADFSINVVVPQRIEFVPGSISGAVTGKTTARRTVSYLLRAGGGQQLTVNLSTSTPNTAGLTIYGLTDGIPLVRAVSGATSWQGVLPFTQDYVIEIVPTADNPFNFALTATVQ
ncbi:MAG: NBR1-Ig-like domain-containing protein [Anaerolineae bacterium]